LRRAAENLDEEAEYIAADDPAAAIRLVAKIRAATSHLGKFPSSGRVGRIPGTRELVVAGTPYIVIYRVSKKNVEILRVFHAARSWLSREELT